MIRCGIVGGGFVGEATSLFKCKDVEVIIYDKNPDRCVPKAVTLQDISKCDIVFVAVNTPMEKSGKCCTLIVESVINDLRKLNSEISIVVRSTVPPGTCDRLNVSFMPEFLTEKNYLEDFKNCKYWILGSKDLKCQDLIKEIIHLANKNDKIISDIVKITNTQEAELCKYIRNCFLALKVSFFNEIFSYCKEKKIDYNIATCLATLDERIGVSHTTVPNYEYGSSKPLYGAGGHCFPKDTNALLFDMVSVGMKSFVLDAQIRRNEFIDRPDKDWQQDKGRAVI